MGRSGRVMWLTGAWLMCACARAPGELPAYEPPPQAETTPASPDAGVADAGVADAGSLVVAPPAQEVPPEACAPRERTLLAETSGGERLAAASPRAHTLVFYTQAGGLRIHDTASGRSTLTQGTVAGFTDDGLRALVLGPTASSKQNLLEVDAARGLIREPVEGALAFQVRDGLLQLSTAEGRTWLYKQGAGELLQVVSTPTARPVVRFTEELQWALSGDAGGFVLWELATGAHWRTPPAQDAALLPTGVGAIYVDARQRAWGWTPATAPVALGRHAPASGSRSLAFRQSPDTGEVLFVGTDGQATLWNPRTGAARVVGSDVVGGELSVSGTHLALLQKSSEGSFSVSTQTLPSGPAWTLWRGLEPHQPTFNREGTRLTFLVPVEPRAYEDPSRAFYGVTLWDVEAGTEVVFPSGRPRVSDHPEKLALSFRDDFGLLHVRYWNELDIMYAARTGASLFSTAHGASSGERSDSSWGPDGVFYGQHNAYPAPPAGGLYAWDPRTGIETHLGSGALMLCHWGARLVLVSGLHRFETFPPGRLQMWNPATSTLETLAPQATFAACDSTRPLVVFYSDWQRSSRDGDTWSPERGTLSAMDLAKGCHQELGTKVERHVILEHGIVYQSEGRVWRTGLP